ncbi:MAG: bifunctional folylpolyglutamate synthase/dihydrofolate synthase [Deltaproteobacteria bacterium]|jgi:dihydrofolate synthase/folylpolyglutamate synthase|nr:bifunctional folylpolyglutamate synthase/dihydrofolate synthase [Deltaproteobacteria bacterium]
MSMTSYREVLARLDALGMFHMDLQLERMDRGLRALDLLSPPYAVVQIAGTNGKGSTSSFLASLGRAHGVRTGLFTSPHMASPRERIRINGETLSEEHWVRLARRVFSAVPELTYFECVCLMAVLAFAEENVQLAVMEAGLGGRFDATTALPADLTCFTSIGFDHMNVLGPGLLDIARDKAAAMRPNVPAITVRQVPEVQACLMAAGSRIGAPLLRAEEVRALPRDWRLGLRGAHQLENAGLALAAWTELARQYSWPARDDLAREGLESAFIPGRLQSIPASRVHPDLLLDGAHNAPAFAALGKALREMDIRPRALVFSCLADKDLNGIVPLALDLAVGAPLFIPPLAVPGRAVPPDMIAAKFGPTASAAPSLEAAVKAAGQRDSSPQTPVLLCGSLYLLAEFFTLYPECLHGRPDLQRTP